VAANTRIIMDHINNTRIIIDNINGGQERWLGQGDGPERSEGTHDRGDHRDGHLVPESGSRRKARASIATFPLN
jgi:hypothetical protein